MPTYKVPKGAETRTNAAGETEYKTQGGNWRNSASGAVIRPKKKGGGTSEKLPYPTGLINPDIPWHTMSDKSLMTAKGGVEGQQFANEYAAQGTANMNRFNDVGPYGSSTWAKDPQTGQWTRNTQLSADQKAVEQHATGANWAAGTGASSMAPQIMNWGNNPYTLTSVAPMMRSDQLDTERQRVENQLMDRFEQRNAPVFDQQRRGLMQELADQGIPMESAQGQKRLQMLAQQQQDARQGAQTEAVNFGGTELTNQFNRSMAGRQQGVTEYEKQRYAPLEEFGQLKGMNTGPVNPEPSTFTPVQMQAPDVAGTGLGYAQIKSNEKLAKMAAAAGGGEGGGGGGLMPFNSQFSYSVPNGGGGSDYGSAFGNFGSGFANGMAAGSKAMPMSQPAQVQQQQARVLPAGAVQVNLNKKTTPRIISPARGLMKPLR